MSQRNKTSPNESVSLRLKVTIRSAVAQGPRQRAVSCNLVNCWTSWTSVQKPHLKWVAVDEVCVMFSRFDRTPTCDRRTDGRTHENGMYCASIASCSKTVIPVYIGDTTEQGVALTGRNHTGPPCSVGRPTAHAPGPPAGSVTDDDRPRAKHCWTIRRASNKARCTINFPDTGVCDGGGASPNLQGHVICYSGR